MVLFCWIRSQGSVNSVRLVERRLEGSRSFDIDRFLDVLLQLFWKAEDAYVHETSDYESFSLALREPPLP
jgi:hypothetical protein